MTPLQARLKESAAHALMAYLFSLGMALTVLGVTGLLRDGWLAAGLLAGLTAACSAVSNDRRVALGAGCVTLFAGAVWLVIGGAGVVVETFRALILHMSGLATALPMVHMPFTVIICVLSLAASWFVTQRSAGAYPALILLVMAAVLLWLGNWPTVLLCLLPAVLCCVTLLLRAGDEATSTMRVLPLAAVVTGVAFAGVAMGGATSEPLKNLADDVRQRIYDTLFYTQPRDVFTLATEGYYPQGMSQLGGPATPREEPVMAVITPRKAYLRGVVKNVYTGRVWLDDIGGRRYLWSASRFDDIRTDAFDMDLPTLDGSADASMLTPTLLQVRMLRDSASTLFVPQRVRTLQAEGDLIPYFNRSSEIFATDNLTLGDVWTVEAALFTSMDGGLSALVNAADAPDDRWDEVCDTYLQLPEHLQPEVYDIASEATAGAVTAWDKAIALQSYLASHYAYTLDAPEQNPEQDFVSSFLLLHKEGYCTYFASAMTVLCRMVGLPARYVEGYVAYPDSEGLAYVTGKEGHAWTEVYFRGFGWVTFDATPTSAEYVDYPPEGTSSDDHADPENTPDPTEEPTPAPSDEPEDAPTPTPEPENQSAPSDEPSTAPAEQDEPGAPSLPWGWLLLVLLILAALRLMFTQPGVQALRQKTEFARWMVYTQACHDALRRRGFIRGKAESPAAFFERVASSGKVNVPLQALRDAENLMFYGHAAPYAEETAQAREIFRALYKGLKPGQKAVFHLQRGVRPVPFTK